MEPLNVIISGSRNFRDYPLLEYVCNNIFQYFPNGINIITGGASGVERLAYLYALNKGYSVYLEKPWGGVAGTLTGYARNKAMAEHVKTKDLIILFGKGFYSSPVLNDLFAHGVQKDMTIVRVWYK